MITQVQRVSIPVSDQDKAKDFYVNKLGFDLIREHSMPMGENVRWLEVGPKGAATSLILGTWFSMAPGSMEGLMLETEDLDSDCDRLQQAGIMIDGPTDMPFGRQATFTDQDGNAFVLATAPPAGI